MGGIIALVVLLFLIVMILLSCIKIVPQAHAYVVERLGAYQQTWSVGLHLKVPFIDKVAKRVILKEQVVDFALTQWSFSRLRTRSCLLTAWRIRSWRLRI